MDPQPQNGPAVLRLGQILDLNAASPLASELLALRGHDVDVDAAAVSRMGAQCLQVLLSARATWRDDGFAFAITGASAEFTAVLDILGAPLDPTFQAWEPSA
jgi:chemotaxis protein CheX